MSDTEVGGIKGFLSLDDSAWDRTIAKAKADVRELGAMDADVKVNADTDRAERRIAALHAAVRELGAESVTVDVSVVERAGGTGQAAAAAQSASAAQREVAQAQDAAARSAEKAAAAEAALAAAVDASETATKRALIAQMRLDEIRGNSKASASRLASAELALDVAIGRSDAAARKAAVAEDALAEAQAAAAASADAETAAQTANAAATSSGGEAQSYFAKQAGLVGAGIAGIIALLGPATAGLVAYGGAATGMGAAGILAVLGIKNAMQQGTDSGQAYSAGLQDLKGDLDSLAGTAALGMLQSFQEAETSVTAAMPELNSQVAVLSGYLGKSGTNLLDGVLNGLKVAEPLFEQGAAVIERWTAGFESWMSNGGMQRFVSYAMTELPRVTSALENISEDAIQVATDLAPMGDAILDISQGVHGLFELQRALDGIESDIAGSGGGGKLFGGALDAAQAALNPLQGVSAAIQKAQPLIDWLTGATSEKVDSSNKAAAAAKAEAAQVEATASAYGMTTGAYQKASAATKKQADSSTAAAAAMQLENDAAGLLTNALTLLNGGALSVAQAQTGVASATNQVTDSFKQNGAAIDGNSAKAVANQQAIQGQVQAAQQMAEAQAKATGSTNAGVEAYKQSKTALEGALRAQGNLTPAVQAYINKLYDVSNLKVKPTKLDVNKSAADAAIAQYKKTVASVPGGHTTKMLTEKQAAEAAIAAWKASLSGVPESERTRVEAEIAAAQANLARITASIAGIPRSITVAVNAVGATNLATTGGYKVAQSHGGTAGHGPLQRFAGGGTSGGSVWGTAGSAFNDRIPTALSIGEEVISAPAAGYAGVRPILKAINANPANAMEALAGGGRQTVEQPIKVYVIGDGLRDVVRVEIEKNGRRQKASLQAGRQ